MNKKCYLTSALLVGGLLLGAQTMQAADRTVTLETSKAVGTEVTLLVNYTYAGVTVDWGDGSVQTYNATSDDVVREVTGTIAGSTITITGNEAWDMLSCENCGITSIDLTGATELRSLYCQNNELTTIDLRGMTSLVDLNLANNQISSITYTSSSNPERDLASIENINLSNNQLSGTFVIRTSTLRSIDVSNNSYSTLYTSYNSKLDMLKCSNNSIKSLSLTSNTALSTLVCDNNVLTSISLPSSLSTMQQLVCDNNAITSRLNLEACDSLSDLSCSNNKLTTVYLPTAQAASSLNFSNNNLTLGVLPKKSLRPTYISFMPQELSDISDLDNVLESDGVPYIALSEWDTRSNNLVDLTDYRYIGTTSSSSGTLDGVITWYSVDADGNETELTRGSSSSAPNDFYVTGAKYAFFTAQPKAFARIVSRSVYADEGFYIETSRVAIGAESVTSIDAITNQTSGLQIQASRRTLTMNSAAPQAVRIYSLDGKKVWDGTVSSSVTVSLPSGVYLVNGKKVAL